MVALECEIRKVIVLGPPEVPVGEVRLVIAEVVWVWFGDDVVNEIERIDSLKLAPIRSLDLRSFLKTVLEGIHSLPRRSAEECAVLDSNS